MRSHWRRRIGRAGAPAREVGREHGDDQLGTVVDLPPGCELCREGELASQWFLLVDGAVAVTRGGRPAGTVQPGEWFGPSDPGVTDALLAATATSVTPVRVLVLDRDDYRALGWLRPRIAAPLASDARL
jgi:CRP-like cAMP-binding protein